MVAFLVGSDKFIIEHFYCFQKVSIIKKNCFYSYTLLSLYKPNYRQPTSHKIRRINYVLSVFGCYGFGRVYGIRCSVIRCYEPAMSHRFHHSIIFFFFCLLRLPWCWFSLFVLVIMPHMVFFLSASLLNNDWTSPERELFVVFNQSKQWRLLRHDIKYSLFLKITDF